MCVCVCVCVFTGRVMLTVYNRGIFTYQNLLLMLSVEAECIKIVENTKYIVNVIVKRMSK